MEYTVEQRAIREYLSKPAPSISGCGCMGPQAITENDEQEFTCELTLNVGDNRLKTIYEIHRFYNMSMEKSKEKLDKSNKFSFEYDFQCKQFKEQLEKVGVQSEMINLPTYRYPECPCDMRYVMEVEGNFYKVIENRSPDGITHEAVLLGPVGGPYI